jgi:parallel beta-helix repeat protein
MSRQREVVGFVFLVLLSLFCIAFFAIDQAEANGQTGTDQPAIERFSKAMDAATDSTAAGYVVYDGVPVEGASVILLRDEAVVYSTTTSLGAGTVPSFTVMLSDPPVSAVVDELLTFAFEYMGDVNRLTFRVAPGEQTLTGYLSSACGETEITDGFIGSDTTWTPECGPYLIRTNVLVMNGATLTVGAGTTVMFDVDKAMLVDGRLLAQGAPNALVSFTAGQGMPWGYLSFYGQSTGSMLEHTLVEYAGSLTVDPNAAVRVDGVDAEFQGLIVRRSLADGIHIFNDGTAMMDNMMVLDNEGCGICLDSDTPAFAITNSTVRDNHGGIQLTGGGSGTISGNLIQGNVSSVGAGLYVDEPGVLSITHNEITGNHAGGGGGGIYIDGSHNATTICDNYIAFNQARQGGGIKAANGAATEISRNFIVFNWADYADHRAGGGLYIASYVLTIVNNVIASNVAVNGGQCGGAWLGYLPDSTVRNNTFARNFSEASGGAAFCLSEPDITLEANTIFSNTASWSLEGDHGAVRIYNYATTLQYNNFFDNRYYELRNRAPLAEGTVNAQFNWWGTVDPTEIQARIYDWSDDATVGVVDFADWLAEPWPAAPVSPPVGLTPTVDESSIDLSWSPNPEADVAGYKIYLDTSAFLFDPAVHGTLPGIDVGLNTSFSLACLPPDTYYLAVTAYDQDADGVDDWTDGNESWFSREMEVTTTAVPTCDAPAAPTALGAVPISASQINLSWTDNATDETGYRVERSPDGGATWTEVASLGVSVTGYSDTGLACESTYHYRVRAHRAGDDQYSAFSNTAQAVTGLCEIDFLFYLPIVLRH